MILAISVEKKWKDFTVSSSPDSPISTSTGSSGEPFPTDHRVSALETYKDTSLTRQLLAVLIKTSQ